MGGPFTFPRVSMNTPRQQAIEPARNGGGPFTFSRLSVNTPRQQAIEPARNGGTVHVSPRFREHSPATNHRTSPLWGDRSRFPGFPCLVPAGRVRNRLLSRVAAFVEYGVYPRDKPYLVATLHSKIKTSQRIGTVDAPHHLREV